MNDVRVPVPCGRCDYVHDFPRSAYLQFPMPPLPSCPQCGARIDDRDPLDVPFEQEKLQELDAIRSERERVEQANEIAGIVFDECKKAWPDLHPVLDLRYGIADALWDAGYRKGSS